MADARERPDADRRSAWPPMIATLVITAFAVLAPMLAALASTPR